MEEDHDPLDPARAFDRLRREVSLCTRAVQGLAAERREAPDYSETLRSIDARLQAAAGGIARMALAPAMRLAPAEMAKELERAAINARNGDRQLLESSHRANADLTHQLRLAIQQVQVAKFQRQRMLWSAMAGAAGGILLMVAVWTLLT
jgi:hypothetical protein